MSNKNVGFSAAQSLSTGAPMDIEPDMLQSSPPAGNSKHALSPPRSEYTLDLNALDLDDDGDTLDNLPKPKVDHVRSEDIDGPSDFTQNMELWMRGGSRTKNGTIRNDKPMDATPLSVKSDIDLRHRDSPALDGVYLSSDFNPPQPITPNIGQWDRDTLAKSGSYLNDNHMDAAPLETDIQPTMSSPRVSHTLPQVSTVEDPLPETFSEKSRKSGRLTPEEYNRVKEHVEDQRMPSIRLAQAHQDPIEPETETATQAARSSPMLVQSQPARTAQSLRKDFSHAHRAQNEMEALKATYRKQLSELVQQHDMEVQQLRLKLQHAQSDENAITGLERQLDAANAKIRGLKESKSNSEQEVSALHKELEITNQSHGEQVARIQKDHLRAVELASTLQRQLQDLRQQTKDLQSPKPSSATPPDSQPSEQDLRELRNELLSVRAELERTQTRHNEALLERDAAQDSLQALQADTDALNATADDQHAVNSALDATLSATLQQRERHWRAKLDALERDRDLMRRTLMNLWGREEMGVSEVQKYAYKYLQAHGQE